MLSKVSSLNPEGDRRRRGGQPRRDCLHGRLGTRGERGGPLWRRHARHPAEGPQRADAQQGTLFSTVAIFHGILLRIHNMCGSLAQFQVELLP